MSSIEKLFNRFRSRTWYKGLFLPFAFVYASIFEVRKFLYRIGLLSITKVDCPVICVGNITVGGSGKSPFVNFLVGEFLKQNFKPAILLRGYGGKEKGPASVSESSSVEDVGDEALMQKLSFKEAVPVVVAKKRANGASFLVDQFKPDVIILDDGLQHFSLSRDVNILLLESDLPGVMKGELSENILPVGRLRESINSALKRIDILILVERSRLSDSERELCVRNWKRNIDSVYSIYFEAVAIRDVFTDNVISIDRFLNKEVFLLAGIANPERFYATAEEIGLKVKGVKSFSDHYQYTKSDWDDLSKISLPLITTQKDAVKLSSFVKSANELYVIEIKPKFKGGVEGDFWKRLIEEIDTAILA